MSLLEGGGERRRRDWTTRTREHESDKAIGGFGFQKHAGLKRGSGRKHGMTVVHAIRGGMRANAARDIMPRRRDARFF